MQSAPPAIEIAEFAEFAELPPMIRYWPPFRYRLTIG